MDPQGKRIFNMAATCNFTTPILKATAFSGDPGKHTYIVPAGVHSRPRDPTSTCLSKVCKA
eukprot:1301888-Amphidinium_carterae.1